MTRDPAGQRLDIGWMGFEGFLMILGPGAKSVKRVKRPPCPPDLRGMMFLVRHKAARTEASLGFAIRCDIATSLTLEVFGTKTAYCLLRVLHVFVFFRMHTLHPECQQTSENRSNHGVFRSMLRWELAVLGVSTHQCEQIRRPSNAEVLQRIYLTADAAREI